MGLNSPRGLLRTVVAALAGAVAPACIDGQLCECPSPVIDNAQYDTKLRVLTATVHSTQEYPGCVTRYSLKNGAEVLDRASVTGNSATENPPYDTVELSGIVDDPIDLDQVQVVATGDFHREDNAVYIPGTDTPVSFRASEGTCGNEVADLSGATE